MAIEIDLAAEAVMLQKQEELAASVAASNRDMFGISPDREPWDYARMRENEHVGHEGPKLFQG